MAIDTIQPLTAPRFKDQYWVKTLKWHLYKRYLGKPHWRTRFVFDGRIRELGTRDLVIDCGANVGEFTVMLAATGATVHAFEPCAYAFSRLQEHTAGLDNVFCYNAAVGAEHGTIKLYRRPDFDQCPESASISSSIFADKQNVDEQNFVEVEMVNLLEFIAQLDREVSLLKIDIEGAEVGLLEAMLAQHTLECCKSVFVETHEDRIPALAERTAKLRAISTKKAYRQKLFFDWH